MWLRIYCLLLFFFLFNEHLQISLECKNLQCLQHKMAVFNSWLCHEPSPIGFEHLVSKTATLKLGTDFNVLSKFCICN